MMMNLKRAKKKDDSSITVNYEKFEYGVWVYHSIRFKSEEKANLFLDKIKKDFTMRLISVEKRTLVYERFIQA